MQLVICARRASQLRTPLPGELALHLIGVPTDACATAACLDVATNAAMRADARLFDNTAASDLHRITHGRVTVA